MTKPASKYRLSFSFGGLFLTESVLTAQLFDELSSWDDVKERVLQDNLFMQKRNNTVTKMFREVSGRLKTLNHDQLQLLVDGTDTQKTQLLFLAVCKYYLIVREFTIKVLRDKYLQFETTIEDLDFLRFWDSRSSEHPELDDITESTKQKIRQVLFKMLREAGLLSQDASVITAPYLDSDVIRLIVQEEPRYLACFLMSDNDMHANIERYAK